MTSKFEQLIEYVINDENAKAQELFHEIVVEKSREIYENLMNEEEAVEECDGCGEPMKSCSCDSHEKELDEGDMGGDKADSLIDGIEADESGMMAEEEDEEEDESKAEKPAHKEFGSEEEPEDLEDRVVDLEDKLDELMAEFENLMAGEGHGDDGMSPEHDAVGDVDGGDALSFDDTDTAEFKPHGEEEEEFDETAFMENVKLDAAPKPKTSEEGFVNTKPTYAVDAGKKGPTGHYAKPITMTGDVAKGRPAPSTKDLPGAGSFRNAPGKGTKNADLEAAPKPKHGDNGQNTRSPLPRG